MEIFYQGKVQITLHLAIWGSTLSYLKKQNKHESTQTKIMHEQAVFYRANDKVSRI